MSSRSKKISLSILVVGILIVICVVVGLLLIRPISSSSSSSEALEEQNMKTLGAFRSIEGTDFLIASVTGGNYDTNILSELFSSGRWYGSSHGYNQYNLVFLDINTEEVYPLLATNELEIVSMEGFPKPVVSFNNQSVPERPAIPIAWWMFSVVKVDTNLDEELSSLDKKTLSVADVGGRGYTEIIPDVDDLLGTAFKNNNTLLIIYRSNGVNYLAHVDLLSRQVVSTEELPLGENIK